jgi:hypothetical protein
MLLTITTTSSACDGSGVPAAQEPREMPGVRTCPSARSFVFFPEAAPERCTVAAIARRRSCRDGAQQESRVDMRRWPLGPVRERPAVRRVTSLLSVAVARSPRFRTPKGQCKDRSRSWSDTAMPLSGRYPGAFPAGGAGRCFLRSLFEPLGYTRSRRQATGARTRTFPAWGEGPYFAAAIRQDDDAEGPADAPVRPDPRSGHSKHYYVGDDEVEKLLKKGEGWLASHPEREPSPAATSSSSRAWPARRWPALPRRMIPSGPSRTRTWSRLVGGKSPVDRGCQPE